MMTLTRMTLAEYDFWAPRSRKSYAEDKMRNNGLTRDEAESLAEADFKRLLPQGFESADTFLFTAKDELQNILGYTWFCVRGTELSRRAFICDVIIEEEFRGQGHGRKIMELIEVEVKQLGLKRIGLHVFGFNETAINLYKSMNYATVDLMMEKTLS